MLASFDVTAASSPFKRCQCGREITRSEWSTLERKGVQQLPGDPFDLELRDCPGCGSTLAIEVPKFRTADELRRGMLLAMMPSIAGLGGAA